MKISQEITQWPSRIGWVGRRVHKGNRLLVQNEGQDIGMPSGNRSVRLGERWMHKMFRIALQVPRRHLPTHSAAQGSKEEGYFVNEVENESMKADLWGQRRRRIFDNGITDLIFVQDICRTLPSIVTNLPGWFGNKGRKCKPVIVFVFL